MQSRCHDDGGSEMEDKDLLQPHKTNRDCLQRRPIAFRTTSHHPAFVFSKLRVLDCRSLRLVIGLEFTQF